MFFDDRRAEYHAGDGGGVVQGVVGQAGDQAEALDHVGDGAQVGIDRTRCPHHKTGWKSWHACQLTDEGCGYLDTAPDVEIGCVYKAIHLTKVPCKSRKVCTTTADAAVVS